MDLKRLLNNQWIVALFLLVVFLSANGYTYGWDDQHVEIPLLKKLIDPTLYPNDYYVDALKQHFTSFLYPILSKIITIDQIPSTYLILYLLSRYFLFFFMFKLWHAISGNSGIAVLGVLTVLLFGRVEEFLYRTFSHQEFALAIIFAGFYFFYRNRYFLASFLFGLAANVHALYSLFPMCYLGFYLLWKKEWKSLGKSSVMFFISAMPFIIWTLKQHLTANQPQPQLNEWLHLYQLACPQNFLFHHTSLAHIFENLKNIINATSPYLRLAVLTLFYALFSPVFRKDRKTQSILIAGGLLLGFSFIFSYLIPVKFILDLNLIRNEQFMLFFLTGYYMIWLWEQLKQDSRKFFIALLVLPLIRFGPVISSMAIAMITMAFLIRLPERPLTVKKLLIPSGLFIISFVILGGMIIELRQHSYGFATLLLLFSSEITILICSAISFWRPELIRRLMSLALFLLLTLDMGNSIYYHALHIKIEQKGAGFWQLQRNWIDMQNYVRENTPEDALLFVPYDMEMGGFRIRSERSIVMSYRDCGVVGFDYQAGEEWKRRLDEIEPFKVFVTEPLNKVMLTAILKYRVDYIVFMNYVHLPENPVLTEVYRNETFKLYKVKR
ncbi:MAG: DUF6798 domain-containing protein [Candidatus Omnitrophota bacterium]